MLRSFFFLTFALLGIGFANASTYLVTNTDTIGVGSFRSALAAANANPGFDEIHFDIPGTGPHHILMNRNYLDPTEILDGVRIDGSTQTGYVPMHPVIVFDGKDSDYFILRSSNIEILGLQFEHFQFACFYASPRYLDPPLSNLSLHHNVFSHCGLAFSSILTYHLNTKIQIFDNLLSSAMGIADIDIGGTGGNRTGLDTLLIERNRCLNDSGYFQGVSLRLTGTGGDTAYANHIVITDNVMQALPGVIIASGVAVRLGGTGGFEAGLQDLTISHNDISGIGSVFDRGIELVVSGTGHAMADLKDVRLDSNRVDSCNDGISVVNSSTCATRTYLGQISMVGNEVIDNSGSGLLLEGSGLSGPTILEEIDVIGNEVSGNSNGISLLLVLPEGGTANGLGQFNDIFFRQNHIYQNLHSGIYVYDNDSSYRRLALGLQRIEWIENSIHDNGWLGIAIDDYYTPTSIECTLPTPTLVQAGILTNLFVQGYIQGAMPNTPYRVEFYLNTAADPSGMGEGENFLGSDTIVLDGNGFGQIGWYGAAQNLGLYVSATATNLATHNTGCFGNAIETLPLVVSSPVIPSLSVFPNPAIAGSDFRFVASGLVKDLQLIGMDASHIQDLDWEVNGSSGYVRLPLLASGVYLLVVRVEDGVICERLILKGRD